MGTEAEMISFSRVLRGYDTQEVDEYLTHLMRYAQQLEARANAAEQSLETVSVQLAAVRRQRAVEGGAEMPARLGQILDLAQEEAQEIRERAYAKEQEITTHAGKEADRLLREASEQRRIVEVEVARLTEVRDRLVSDLRRLAAEIAAAADERAGERVSETAAAVAPPDDPATQALPNDPADLAEGAEASAATEADDVAH